MIIRLYSITSKKDQRQLTLRLSAHSLRYALRSLDPGLLPATIPGKGVAKAFMKAGMVGVVRFRARFGGYVWRAPHQTAGKLGLTAQLR